MSYESFLSTKRSTVAPAGFAVRPEDLHPALFPFQRDSVAWALGLGRAALFLDTGLGKTLCQLTWADQVARKTEAPVIVFAPLAVAHQTRREGERFGIQVRVCRESADVGPGINIANYERLAKFDPSVFSGVVLDESGILKSFMGSTKRRLVESFASTPYRLCCSATPAPNDHLELGNHCEFLGVMQSFEMIARWFINDFDMGVYRLKGHGAAAFWDWVASWARAAENPTDLGYPDDARYVLPELRTHHHVVDVDVTEGRTDGALFRVPDMSATAVHAEKRRTARRRAAKVAELVAAEPAEQWLIWTDTDYEAEELMAVLPADAVEVAGSDSDAAKEDGLLGFADGKHRILVTKSRIAGLGMNWQNCARVAFVGPSFSYEAFYQSVRRVWRFGQTRPVDVHVVMATTESHIWDVVSRKAGDHSVMKREMRAAMLRAHAKQSPVLGYQPKHQGRLPQWLVTH